MCFLRRANNKGNGATYTYEEEGSSGGDMAQVAKVKVEVVDQAGGVVGTVLSHECASIRLLPNILALVSIVRCLIVCGWCCRNCCCHRYETEWRLFLFSPRGSKNIVEGGAHTDKKVQKRKTSTGKVSLTSNIHVLPDWHTPTPTPYPLLLHFSSSFFLHIQGIQHSNIAASIHRQEQGKSYLAVIRRRIKASFREPMCVCEETKTTSAFTAGLCEVVLWPEDGDDLGEEEDCEDEVKWSRS